MSFNDFNFDARLNKAIAAAGYETPTPIQAAAIPIVMTGADLIGTAQTGTGKTAAFVLPILQKLLNTPSQRQTRCMIVTPTRELAEQINDVVEQMAKNTPIRSAAIYGGVGMNNQARALRDGVEILVVCPGRLLDHVGQGNGDFRHVDTLVLDEADRMFDMGFLPSVKRIISMLPAKRQTVLFSATFPREVEELASSVLHQPKRVSVSINRAASTVSHALYPVPQHLKTNLLVELIKKHNPFSLLVFTRTKHKADRVAGQLTRLGFESAALHSDRTQNQRQRALEGFKKGKYQVLVATDIAARGLDIETVSHVINYDIPASPDDYIHRIGRTGRAEREGDAFTLITPEDHQMVRDIERTLGKSIARQKLEGFNYSEPPKPALPQTDMPIREVHSPRPSARPASRPSVERKPARPAAPAKPITRGPKFGQRPLVSRPTRSRG